MNQLYIGNAFMCGDNVDTDMIIPSEFLTTADEKELGKHLFANCYPDINSTLKVNDILVAGRNFGCGSSREHAPLAIRGSGFSCIIAESFARTFYRNCINRGIPVIELPDASQIIHSGDRVTVDLVNSKVTNCSTGKVYTFLPFPAFVMQIWEVGGLFGYIQNRLNGEKNEEDT